MTTSYEGIPALDERLAGAELILIGAVQKMIDVELHTVDEVPEVHSVFSVAVQRVLAGTLDADHIELRVVGGSAEGVETEATTGVREGPEMLFLLSRDYGPNRPPTAFVPYFRGCYALKGNVVSFPEGRSEVAKVRSMISSIGRSVDREQAALEELEPARLRRRPYQPVLEMPEAPARGPVDAAPGEPASPTARSGIAEGEAKLNAEHVGICSA